MADVASPHLIRAMIAKNSRRLAGRLAPPRGVSLYRIYEETVRLRQNLARHEADAATARAAKRKRLPYPSDLAGGPYSARISNAVWIDLQEITHHRRAKAVER